VGLDKRQTSILLALAALGCLVLVIGIAVVVRPVALRATPTPIPAASRLPARSITPTATPVFTQTEMLVLLQVAQRVCCKSSYPCGRGLYARETGYSLSCWVAAGHSSSVEIQRFPDRAAAHAAFEKARGNNPVERFHSYPATAWQYDENPTPGGLPMRHRQHAWQADRWLIIAGAFDDTHFAIAPEPKEVSEIVYQEAAARCLFPGVC
jgi:hypothetical protein